MMDEARVPTRVEQRASALGAKGPGALPDRDDLDASKFPVQPLGPHATSRETVQVEQAGPAARRVMDVNDLRETAERP
jgi:hypothetical protein